MVTDFLEQGNIGHHQMNREQVQKPV